jgi:hypothetical protein
MSSWPDCDEEYLGKDEAMERSKKNARFARLWRESKEDIELAKSIEAYEYREALENYYCKKEAQKVKRDIGIALYSRDRKQS